MKRSTSKILMIIPVVFALFLAHSTLMAQDTKPFVGTWNGALSVVGQELEIIIEFSLDESKNIQGNIDVPAQGATDIPLGEINIEGKKIPSRSFIPKFREIRLSKGNWTLRARKLQENILRVVGSALFLLKSNKIPVSPNLNHFPLKVPLRFSKKAFTPSFLSSVVQVKAWR